MDGETQARLIWDEAISKLEAYPQIGARDLAFLKDVKPNTLAGNMLIVTVSQKTTRDIIQNKLASIIRKALKEATGNPITCLVNLDETLVVNVPATPAASEAPAAPAVTAVTAPANPAPETPATPEPPAAGESDEETFAPSADEMSLPLSFDQPQPDVQPTFGFDPAKRHTFDDHFGSSHNDRSNNRDDFYGEPTLEQTAEAEALLTSMIETKRERKYEPPKITQPISRDDKVVLPPPRIPATMLHNDRSDVKAKKGASPRPVVVRNPITHLNSQATFENFVPGESNRFARAAAIAVSESPGTTYNPLFIYGRSGLGKTHLLNAIGNAALNMYPKFKVRYVTSEEFTNEFIDAVQKSSRTKNDGQIPSFNKRYREVDLLLIDDIQFLKGKEQTVEQFFHTFNTLYNNNKQIVIASDVAPKFLEGFEPRLISRFEMGLPVDVQPPSEETRIAILRMKASMLNIDMPFEVLELIARQVKDNIRELEGALTRVAAVASLSNQPVTRSLAEQALQDFFIQDVEVTPTDIISKTANYFGLTFDDIVSSDRSKKKVMARQIAMYITHEMTSLPVKSIGENFGGKDHSTVLHACKKVSALMAEKPDVYNCVIELTKQLKQHSR